MRTQSSIYSRCNPELVKLFEQAGHPSKLMCVALDYAKAQHTALICNGLGDLLKGSFVIDNNPKGVAELLRHVRETCKPRKIRYRVSSYAAGVVDYLLYLDDGKQGEGVPLIKGDRIRADGQWHTQAFYLVAEHVTSPVSGLALQCFATAAGNARLDVDYVSLTDLPPADAEGYEAPREPQQVWPVKLEAADWQVQPSWVGNFSAANRCAAEGAGLVFKVPESSRGAKWSHTLPAPLTGAAIWIEGIRDKWFTPETRAQIALNRRVMRENRNCFISDHAPGSQYLDEMTGDPLKPRIAGQKAYLPLTLSPRDVVVVSRGLFVQ